MTTTLYIVRHGETEENVAQILQGHLPGHLTERGREQAAELRNRLLRQHLQFDAMLVSDLQRCIDTAHIINEGLHLDITLCPLLRERDCGSLTGHTIAEAQTAPLPDDVENVEQLFERARRFLHYACHTFPRRRVLCISHGLFSRCIIAAVNGCKIGNVPRMQNAEIRCIEVNCNPTDIQPAITLCNDPLITDR